MGQKGELIESGSIGSYSGPSVFKINSEFKKKIELISLSSRTMWVVLEDNTVWFKGTSNRHSLPDDNSVSTFTPYNLWEGKAEDEIKKIVAIAAHSYGVYFLTDDGKIFQRGEDIFKVAKEYFFEPTEVNLPKGTTAKRIWVNRNNME